ncbi:hypothetical protein BGZ46_002623 [Entomortierella lignicola]|nr:hypothetical protein BGZ46_002623 [Entomortierella lignicola]
MSFLIQFFKNGLKYDTQANALKALLTIAVYYVYKYRAHAIGTRPRLDLKQPKGAVPFLGHLPLVSSVPLTEMLEFFEKQDNELGPVWSMSLPGLGRLIQIDTPELLEYTLKTNFWNYSKGPMFVDMVKVGAGRGIFTAEGARWKSQRHQTVSVFSIKAFRELSSNVFVTEGKKVLEHLGRAADEGTVLDLQNLFLDFTMDSFGVVSFGESPGCLSNNGEPEPFVLAMDEVLEIIAKRLNNPFWKITEHLDGQRKIINAKTKLLRDYSRSLIEKRRKEASQGEKKDLIQLLLEGEDENGEQMPDELIIDNIITFMTAGRDTTAHSLTWMFYLLLRDGADKSMIENLVRESDEVLQGEDPTYESYKKQKYAEACFYEAIRVYPAVARNVRYCEKDDVLPDGTKVYKGEWISWSPFAMSRNESIWGPDAKEYKPSRWIGTERPPTSKFNSFHTGPRICPGQQFATVEALTIMGMILQSFELKLVDPTVKPKYVPSLAFPMAGGLSVRVTRRPVAVAV